MATIASALTWPETLERERSLLWEPAFMNEVSEATLDGTVQVRNSNGGGLWRMTMNSVQLRAREHQLAWHALEVQLKGGLEPIDIPLLFCARPRPADLSPIVVTIVGSWDSRATFGTIDLVNAGEVVAGMHFSVYDAGLYGWRLYRISYVNPVEGEDTQREIEFWPPLRTGRTDGDTLEFDAPRCVMKLAQSNSMNAEFVLRKTADPSAMFVEAF